jgi:hypothetical protein
MFKKIGKYLIKVFGGRTIGKVSRWGFWTIITFFGPGPIVTVIGVEGLIATAAITHSGLIDYAGDRIVKKIK